jgi:replication-associated recombination protein RarA
MSIRNPVTKLMENIGYGKDYTQYTKESLLPDKIKDKKYYKGKDRREWKRERKH